MAPDTAAVAAFLSERHAAPDRRLTADQQAIWAAVKRERWNYQTIAAAFTAVRTEHEAREAAAG
jgi:hypothetical protein